MRLVLSSLAFSVVTLVTLGCPNTPPASEGEGAGEGEGAAGEGEGAAAGEGEGAAAGEGEGAAAGEGEGAAAGEGEGAAAGEGEGEGTSGVGADCADSSVCGPGLSCGFDTSGAVLRSACETTPSTGAAGTPCNDATQCGFHLCEEGQCSQPCNSDDDCAATQKCNPESVSVDGKGGVLHVCIPDGTLPATPCTKDGDCTSTNRVCDDLQQDGQSLVLQCGFPGAGAGHLGDTCDSASLEDSTQCATGLCDGGADGVGHGACTQACSNTTDCGAVGAFICTGSGFSNVPNHLCAKFCAKDADCGGNGRSCQIRDNEQANQLDQVCSPNDGALTPGTAVVAPQTQGDCSASFAIPQGATLTCSAICQVDADCTAFAPATHCGSVNFTLPGGSGTQGVNACVKP